MRNDISTSNNLNKSTNTNLVIANKRCIESGCIFNGYTAQFDRFNLYARLQITVLGWRPNHIHNLGLRHLVWQDHLECEGVVWVARFSGIHAVIANNNTVNLVNIGFSPLHKKLRQHFIGYICNSAVLHSFKSIRNQFGHLCRRLQLGFHNFVADKMQIIGFFINGLTINNTCDQIANIGKPGCIFLFEYRLWHNKFAANNNTFGLGQSQKGNQMADILADLSITTGIQFRSFTFSGIETTDSVQLAG